MNQAIADVVRRMAVNDGTLQQSISKVRGTPRDGFETVTGSGRLERAHPANDTSRPMGMGQSKLMAVSPGPAPRTTPGAMEVQGLGPDRVSDERGMDPNALIEFLMSMGLPEPAIQAVLMEMGYGG